MALIVFLRFEEKRIQKVSSSTGGPDGSLSRLLWRSWRSASGELPARSSRAAVHCFVGVAVWGEELLGHGRVRLGQTVAFERNPDAQAWDTEPRHLRTGVSHARSSGLRGRVPALHGSLCEGGADREDRGCGGAGRQGLETRLRARTQPYAERHRNGLGRPDPR